MNQTSNQNNSNRGPKPEGARGGRNFSGRGGNRGGRDRKRREGSAAGEAEEFEQRILDIARVTRVMAGGKRMRFRACVALGNKKGKISIGLAKGADVTMAVTKAVNQAKKAMIDVPIVKDSIPHEVRQKYGAAKIILKPAGKGRGVIAGGVVRVILELAGYNNVIGKILGTNNKLNNARCTLAALAGLKKSDKMEAAKTDQPKIEKNDSPSESAKIEPAAKSN